MKTKKILIVEDEQIIAENLRFILNDYGYKFVDVAMDTTETKALFKNTSYNLVLMDINLGNSSNIDGIDLIKLLATKHTFAHIYVTANADIKTVNKAKNTNPAGYIVKPFLQSSIYANVEIALNTLKNETYFAYINKGRHEHISTSKITNIEADGAYSQIYTEENHKILVRQSLAEILQSYPSIFIRIHRSILINKSHIQAYTSAIVKVNNKKLSLGRAYKHSFAEEIKDVIFS